MVKNPLSMRSELEYNEIHMLLSEAHAEYTEDETLEVFFALIFRQLEPTYSFENFKEEFENSVLEIYVSFDEFKKVFDEDILAEEEVDAYNVENRNVADNRAAFLHDSGSYILYLWEQCNNFNFLETYIQKLNEGVAALSADKCADVYNSKRRRSISPKPNEELEESLMTSMVAYLQNGTGEDALQLEKQKLELSQKEYLQRDRLQIHDAAARLTADIKELKKEIYSEKINLHKEKDSIYVIIYTSIDCTP